MKIKLLIISIVLFFVSSLYALDSSVLFTAQEKALVKQGNMLTTVYLKYSDPISTYGSAPTGPPVIPDTRFTRSSWMKNELVVVEKAWLPGPYSPLTMAKALTRYSGLKGMQYFSKRAQAANTLVKDSYRTSKTGDTGRLKDPELVQVPDSMTSWLMMQDNRFGKLLYSSRLYSGPGYLVLDNRCASPLKKFGFTIAGAGKYQVLTILFRDGDRGWFLYSVTTSPVKSSLFLKLKLVSPKSFGNRVRAATVHLARSLGIDWKKRLAAFR